MREIFRKRFFTEFTKAQLYLILGSFLLVFFLILFSNLGIFPLKNISDFLFFTFLLLLFSLYRPGWAFLIFVGTITLENINLAPENIGIMIRPYQFLSVLIILAILIRILARRLNFKLLKLKWYDGALIVLAAAGFLSSFGANDKMLSLKLSIILSTFVALYLLARNFVRDLEDLKKIIPFFLSSSVVLVLYGIWQNIRFMKGLESFEIMPGRPNGTFMEADWLGIYLVFLIAAIYSFIYYQITNYKLEITKKLPAIFLYILLVFSYTAIILTVSRSAWLGALATTAIFLLVALTNLKIKPKFWQWKQFFHLLQYTVAAGFCSIAIVYFFNLASFQLLNRAQSTGTGLQKITISCKENIELPEKIAAIEELEKFGCRHINLEDIEKELGQNNVVKEIYRDDPNVNTRKEIYEKSLAEIKKHPLLGIGWGNISNILGKDARGAGLNASNIFLEIWLGSGILGLLAFVAVWIYILIRAILNYAGAASAEEKAFTTFVITAWVGLTISNLFNSGIMLGFLWLYLAVSFIDFYSVENSL